MYYTIYKTTNKVNGKFYIGTHKTRNLDDNYHGSGKYLKRAIEKHGIENFTKEILFVFDNPEEMFAKEAEIVNEDFLAEENTYNLKLGGSGGFDHLNHSDYANPSHSIDHMKMMNTARNCKLTADERSRISAIANKVRRKRMDENGGAWWSSPGFSGRTHTDSTKKKIGANSKKHQAGEKNSQYGTMWITDGVSNKKIKKNDMIPNGWAKGRK